MLPYKRLTYKKDKKNGGIRPPEIFLCNRRLDTIGKLYPVVSPTIIVNYNAADEISFSYHKELNGRKTPFYDELKDLSIIKAEDTYYEISVTETDQGNLTKNVSGRSLGYCELSQKLVTLEVNTENDIARSDYEKASIFFDPDNPGRSLLHRLLSYAPDYSIGYVAPTLAILQRTFSWSDSFMDSCLNDISQEVNCIFTIDVKTDPSTKLPVRQINAYDACYCINCWEKLNTSSNTELKQGDYWKNVIDGRCHECGGTNIYDPGEDTTITINTKNLTDEIQITTDKDSVKNCFQLKAGDDTMTNIVQGVDPCSSGKIMMFSEEQVQEMSSALRTKWKEYLKKTNNPDIKREHKNLLALNFHILDLIQYLESGMMPQLETEKGTLEDQYNAIKSGLSKYGYQFYIESETEGKHLSARNAIKNLLSTFLLEGYSLQVESTGSVSENKENGTCFYWYGSFNIYETSQRENSFTVTVDTSGETISFHTTDSRNLSNIVNSGKNYKIVFGDKDQASYEAYLKQQVSSLLGDRKIQNKNSDITDWSPYCINRLESYYDGFDNCINMLENKKISLPSFSQTSSTANSDEDPRQKIINTLKDTYKAYMSDINKIKTVLEDQVFSLYYYLGDTELLKEKYPPRDNTQQYYYHFSNFTMTNTTLNARNAVNSMLYGIPVILNTYREDGTVLSPASKTKNIGKIRDHDRGVQCVNCGSTALQYHSGTNSWHCGNTQCGDNTIIRYSNYAESIRAWCYANPSSSIISRMDQIRKSLNIKSFMGNSLYQELCSFVREDIYSNENYRSENLRSNTELIQNAYNFVELAKKHLSKACVSQISISADVANLVVQDDLKSQDLSLENAYEKFVPGNYIRAVVDNNVYKLRVISITYPYDAMEQIQVTFSNVTKTLSGSSSDLQSILSQAQSMSTSFSTVSEQAKKGNIAAKKFDYIKRQGLDSSLGAVKTAQNQTITIDDKGFLCTRYDKETGQYDDHQLKIINSNIVMTDDNWNTSKLAIGLGRYGDKMRYGVWADLLVGDLIVGKELNISNETGNVRITGDGIVLSKDSVKSSSISGLDEFKNLINESLGLSSTTITSDFIISPKIGGGYLHIKNPNDGRSVTIDPQDNYNGTHIFSITDRQGKVTVGVDPNGNASFYDSSISGGTINIGSGNFMVNSRGKLTAKGGIYFENELVSWNGTSCFKNDENEFLVQQEQVDGPVVKLSINSNQSYMLGKETSIHGDIVNIGNITSDKHLVHTISIENNHISVNDSMTVNGTISVRGTINVANAVAINGTLSAGSTLSVGDTAIVQNDIHCNYIKVYNTARTGIFPAVRIQSWSDGAERMSFGFNGCGFVAEGTHGWMNSFSGWTQNSDEKIKKDFNTLEKYEPFFFDIKPFSYRYIDGTSGRTHIGFGANQIRESLENNQLTTTDFAGFVNSSNDENGKLGLIHTEFVALNTHMIQKLYQKFDNLEQKLTKKGLI